MPDCRLIARQMEAKRRYVIVAIFILAAVATPPDVLSQLSLAVPLLLFYEAAIWGLRAV